MDASPVEPLDPFSSVPPFEQLRTQIATRATSGDLPAGTRLPTVRALAEQLGLATNTVAKAYRALESDGVIATEGRRGTFIARTAAAGDSDVTRGAQAYVAQARAAGLTLAEAQLLVAEAWSR